jgi:preprotein translocase subunit SecE
VAAKSPGVFSKIKTFFTESWQELQKVSWPSRAEVRNFTLVVITVVVAVGVMLFLCDSFFGLFTKKLFAR